jgi:hypothetical protein
MKYEKVETFHETTKALENKEVNMKEVTRPIM